ncbi:uncharacterized protein [Physcomitrium patens]|uniref:WW domain-containing protein n=2 Tax=Physcomitrium patens TaxID=3218 RepID=A0A7I4F3X6_PHYPA|nr:uncharacterized protein LOC112291068 [Physcomitrium patens]|eukprot:XP_024393798.1 uncharacterized protein LOC112291068 [Physcomitrella patens]
MAVAMEVSWRGSELGSPVLEVKKKRAWGADAQKLMQLMMGQLPSEGAKQAAEPSVTLDLLGKADPPSSGEVKLESSCLAPTSPEFLELDPSEEPLPSVWEKCLDLKTGKLYYVNKCSGVSSYDDPRMRSSTELPLAHEFLGSKQSETLRQECFKASSSSSSGSPRNSSRHQRGSQLLPFSARKQQWNLQLDDRRVTLSNRNSPELADEPESHLELDLNLAAGGASSASRRYQQQTVCTMEMIQNALQRTESITNLVKREFLSTQQHKRSSSFSSLNSSRSEALGASPSTSSSSSTSSRTAHRAGPVDESRQSFKLSTTGVCEAESVKAENIVAVSSALVMGACTRCLMYVMLSRDDPRCPRCEAEVPVDFGNAPVSKRQRVGPHFGSDRR